MPRLKLTTFCLLAAVCALAVGAAPGEAPAKGVCDKIKILPKKGCVTSKDVKNGSLTADDMKNEAGADFAEGGIVFRNVPDTRQVYASVDLTAPTKGVAVVTANVRLTTTTPGHQGGTLECQITKGKNLDLGMSIPFRGSVARTAKWAESMLFSANSDVKKGTTRFNLVCRRIPSANNTFNVSSFLVAEYYRF